MAIIGISGKIGSGKDTIANIIQYLVAYNLAGYMHPMNEDDLKSFLKNKHDKLSDWQIKKFAGKLKEIVALLIGCSLEDLENQEFKNTPLSNNWSIWRVKNEFTKITIPNKIFLNEEEVKKFCDETSNSQHHYTYWEDKMTPRKLLQLAGTEFGRELVHPNCWINSLFNEYKNIHNFTEKVLNRGLREGDNNYLKGKEPNWIITDVRFENEAEAIKQRKGIIVRVNRYPRITVATGQGFTRTEEFDSNNKQHQDLWKGECLKQHPSENSLDDYKNFDYIIENTGTIEDLIEKVKYILQREEII